MIRGNKQKSRRTSPALFCTAMLETIKLSFRYNNFSIFFKLSQLLSFDIFLKLKIGKETGRTRYWKEGCHFALVPLTSLSLVSTVLLVITQSDSRLYKN